jgi:hypothetical protein
MKTEDALLQIIGMVKGLVKKLNLGEFIDYLIDKNVEVKRLKGEILRQIGRYLGGGEMLFDSFLDFHENFLFGLAEAGLLPSGRKIGDGRWLFRYINAYGEV